MGDENQRRILEELVLIRWLLIFLSLVVGGFLLMALK